MSVMYSAETLDAILFYFSCLLPLGEGKNYTKSEYHFCKACIMKRLLLLLLLHSVPLLAMEPVRKMDRYQARALLLDFKNRSAEEQSRALKELKNYEKPQTSTSNINKKSGCVQFFTELYDTMNLKVYYSDAEPGMLSVTPIEVAPWVENSSDTVSFVADSLSVASSWLTNNFYETNYTAVVRITRGRIEDVYGRPARATRGYVNHVYEAKVIEHIRGESQKTIRYYVMAEAGMPLHLPAYPKVVSLCSAEKSQYNRYFTPDNGYTLPLSKTLYDTVERLKLLTVGKKASACE